MLVENGSGGGKGGSDGGGGGGNGSNGSGKTSVTSSPSGGNNGSSNMDHLKYTPPHVLIRSISSLSQHSIRPHTPEMQDMEEGMICVAALRKGVLLQARDRLFSRWKERYFVLTRDYLSCFRRGTTKYSEMGPFIFKVNLASVEQVEWQDRRGGPALALALPREGRVLLRAKSGLDQWYRSLLEATQASRQRRNALRRGTSTTHLNFNNNCDGSPLFKSSGLEFSLSDSTPEIARLCDVVSSDTSPCSRINNRHHRFSLLSDVDIGSVDTDMATPPSSVTSSNKFSTSTSTSTNSGSGGSSSLASSPSLRGSGGGWPRNVSPHRPSPGLGESTPRSGRPASPMRTPTSAPIPDNPRSRLSLYEGTHIPTTAKTRHSLCVEPRDRVAAEELAARKQKNRHSICVEPRELVRTREQSAAGGLGRSRASLCLEPRNPLLDLMESVEALPTLTPPPPPPTHGGGVSTRQPSSTSVSPRASPAKAGDLAGRRGSNPGVSMAAPVCGGAVVSTSPSPGATPHRPRAHSTSLTPERTLGPRSRSNLGFFRHSGLFNH
ncbi:unnamed protein product [Meganyctiphanes norvegica]|uniref:PH domain-containing protein n=1 Tax=Meganyctiphanes norvegica TaxID=48144 RepID=A0AAV2RM35_MEGNR